MIHEKSNVGGTITVKFASEDWVWLCNLLNQILKSEDLDRYSKDDTEHLLSLLQKATNP